MFDSAASKDVRKHIGRTVARALGKAIKIISLCKEDPERQDKPIVAELATVTTEVMRILVGHLKNRGFQGKWSKLDQYLEMLEDIGCQGKH